MHIDLGLDTYMGFIIDHLDNTPLEVMYEDKDVPELMTAREIAVKLSNPSKYFVCSARPKFHLFPSRKRAQEMDERIQHPCGRR